MVIFPVLLFSYVAAAVFAAPDNTEQNDVNGGKGVISPGQAITSHNDVIRSAEQIVTSNDQATLTQEQVNTESAQVAIPVITSSDQVISNAAQDSSSEEEAEFAQEEQGWSSYTSRCAIASREPKVWQRIQLLLHCEKDVKSPLPSVPRTEIPIEDILQIMDKDLLSLDDSSSYKSHMDEFLKELPPVTGSFVEFLYKNLAVADREQVNIAVSPLSLEVVLAAVGLGAGSFTQEEIFRVLEVDQHTLVPKYISKIAQLHLKSLTSLQMATKLYLEKSYFPVKDDFKNALNDIFEIEIDQANFQLAASTEIETINLFVSEKMEGHISDGVGTEDANPQTSLLLVNMLYFKGEWELPFDKQMGFNDDFNLPHKKMVQATYMSRDAEYSYYKEIKERKYRMLELPYLKTETTGPYSMIIILPDEIDGLDEVERHLTEDDCWLQEFDLHSTKHTAVVKPTIPRFSINTKIDLKTPLNNMGITFMFEDSADFQGITDQNQKNRLKVGELNQRVFIDVDERGSKAPVHKGSYIPEVKGIKQNPIDFNANHPFVFALIQRDTKTVLLMGHIVKPGYDDLFGIEETTN